MKSFFSFIHILSSTLQRSFSKQLADQYSWMIASHIFSASKTELLLSPPIITHEDEKRARDIIKNLLEEQMPIEYIIGSMPFLELSLNIIPPLLIPRSETEALVAHLITQLEQYKNKPLSILDIGTGSGCIALSLAHYFSRSTVYAVDISEIALSLCKQNATKNKIFNIVISHSDLYTTIEKRDFDLIISNPPYLSKKEWQETERSVREWEDFHALVAPDDGFSLLSQIITKAPTYTNRNSVLASNKLPQLVVEIGHTQGEAIQTMMKDAGYKYVTVWKDQYGKDRAVLGASLL